ncbi:MAG: hypothetical protein AB7J40_00815 [Candidatus Altimarinota bacterium]
MRLFRFKKRSIVRRAPIVRKKWDTKPRRSRFLKLRQLLKGRLLMVLGILLGIGGTAYGFFFTTLLDLRQVEVTTAYKDINIEKLQTHLQELVVGQHFFFLSLSTVAQEIYDHFPDVSSIACSRNIFTRALSCEAIGYELIAIIKHENERYYINENGVVINYDSRKLGLPFFDLILNPVFAEIENRKTAKPSDTPVVVEEVAEAVLQPAQPSAETPQGSLTASILNDRSTGTNPAPAPATIITDLDVPETSLFFIQPDQAPPVEPLILEPERKVFTVTIGQKILDPDELKTILEAIQKLEQVMGRKVIEAQYVQVAGELSLKSKPGGGTIENQETIGMENSEPSTLNPQPSDEDPEHEFTVLLNLRRDVDDQIKKLSKSKEVIDFSQVTQIDLSIDGEKVFYR